KRRHPFVSRQLPSQRLPETLRPRKRLHRRSATRRCSAFCTRFFSRAESLSILRFEVFTNRNSDRASIKYAFTEARRQRTPPVLSMPKLSRSEKTSCLEQAN